ncbi:class I SAM-dependent methyltransferase [Nisaea acidiphila]|uniref:Class I SAM-dependent methyltransferase n=1 Tax=Nisaea acidiphila TaxID=1862145 RepID=A0A9J7ANR7_9PROT|nr:class I SAM-dependent methyltransferase [Nisaea acidiphila]UUX49275.1 class I SAM-dependent methyltransferase [Nisaea acidiphila]
MLNAVLALPDRFIGLPYPGEGPSREVFEGRLAEAQHILDALRQVVLETGEPIEGDLLHRHHSDFEPARTIYPKALGLHALAADRRNVLEIGFNAGISTLIMLLANKELKVTAVDICDHGYTRKCFAVLEEHFPGRVRLVPGDSLEIMTNLGAAGVTGPFDLLHVDGYHMGIRPTIDAAVSLSMADQSCLFVLDDTHDWKLRQLFEFLKLQRLITPLSDRRFDQRFHRIGWVNRVRL